MSLERALGRPVAEVFGRVFVLTAIFIRGGGGGIIKYERRRRKPLGGSWGMLPEKILKSRGLEMLFSALCRSISQTLWNLK